MTHQMIRKTSKDPVGSAVRQDMMNYEVIPAVTWWYLVTDLIFVKKFTQHNFRA